MPRKNRAKPNVELNTMPGVGSAGASDCLGYKPQNY